jgi:hypothetical protein
MAASSTNVEYLIGELYDAMGADKATIVTAMISRGAKYVEGFTGESSGDMYDTAVETWAAVFILQRMVSGSNSTNAISLGAISIGKKDVGIHLKSLKADANAQLKAINRSKNLFKLTQQINYY